MHIFQNVSKERKHFFYHTNLWSIRLLEFICFRNGILRLYDHLEKDFIEVSFDKLKIAENFVFRLKLQLICM